MMMPVWRQKYDATGQDILIGPLLLIDFNPSVDK